MVRWKYQLTTNMRGYTDARMATAGSLSMAADADKSNRILIGDIYGFVS